jgi:predicted transcriptional regulator
MPKSKAKRLTPLEALIMDCVWNKSEATVREVQEALQREKPMAYNTVLTMMRILRDKGFLASERDGRVDVYRPLVEREQVAKRSLNDVLQNFFSGSAHALVSQLLDSEELDPDEMRAIRKEVDRRLRQGA